MNRLKGKMSTVADLKYRPGKPHLADAWQDIIRREIDCAADEPEYVAWLQEALADEAGGGVSLTQAQPLLADVEQALQQGCRKHTRIKAVWQPWLQQLYRAKNKTTPAADLISTLQSQDWLDRFIGRHTLAARGGEMVRPLSAFLRTSSGPGNAAVYRVLTNISLNSKATLASEQAALLCVLCLTRCDQHWIDLPLQRDVPSYGCRLCQQSRTFLYHPAPVVVVLDDDRQAVNWLANNQLHVNWLVWPKLFDFDQILIARAGDEAVERFAVMVGNDTDPYRQPRYKDMICVNDKQNSLSDNSLRILANTFAQVTAR